MSNIIPFNSAAGAPAEVPAHLIALFGGEGESNIAPRVTINQLSYRGKVWRRIVDGEETPLTKLDKDTGDQVPVQIISLVVLDHNKLRSRAFYSGGFEEGKNAKPDCASMDGVKPDASIKEPCAATCAACPNAVKGSKITEQGKQSTACSPSKRVAVIPSAAIGKHPALLLRLAQTSVWDKDNTENEAKGWYAWDQYLDMLRARGAKHTAAVETKAKFDTRMAYPKLLFSANRWLNPEEAAAAKQCLTDMEKEIGDILNGGTADGVMGLPAAGSQAAAAQQTQTTAQPADDGDAAAKAAAASVAAAEAAAKAEAKKKADAKAARKAAADAAAKAAADAAAAAAAAAAEDDDEGDAFGAAAAAAATPAATTAAPAQTAAATPAATVTSETPAGLADLLAGWDDGAE